MRLSVTAARMFWDLSGDAASRRAHDGPSASSIDGLALLTIVTATENPQPLGGAHSPAIRVTFLQVDASANGPVRAPRPRRPQAQRHDVLHNRSAHKY
jgi:hypothetical protein